MRKGLFLLGAWLSASVAHAAELSGEAVQGGLIFGHAEPGTEVEFDGKPIQASSGGNFVIGFGRDERGSRTLEWISPSGAEEQVEFDIALRDYDIDRIDGLPPRTVTPDPEAAQRIREENRLVATAKARRDNRTDYAQGFSWPATGRVSGVYGSQRILNGEPRNPHYGLDIAAPTGTLVTAPAPGIITLTHPDMYYSGGTIILDHGQGLSSSFLHLSEILVEAGQRVATGDPIGRIGATGRATGPHLDWRMSWLDRRVDPQRLLPAMPSEE